jgi:hypothetical protein
LVLYGAYLKNISHCMNRRKMVILLVFGSYFILFYYASPESIIMLFLE